MVRSRPLLDRPRPKVGGGFLRFFSQFYLRPQTLSSAVIQKITEKHGKLKEFTEKHGNLCGGESFWYIKGFSNTVTHCIKRLCFIYVKVAVGPKIASSPGE